MSRPQTARRWLLGSRSLVDHRIDCDEGTTLASPLVETNNSVRESKEGKILAPSDVATRFHGAADLTNQDVAGSNNLAAEFLDAAALRLRVAAVLDRTLSFFMCHGGPPLDADLSGDLRDLEFGVRLPVTLLFAVVPARFEFVDDDLRAATLAGNCSANHSSGDRRRTDLNTVATAHQENLQVKCAAHLKGELLDLYQVPNCDPVLFTPGADYGMKLLAHVCLSIPRRLARPVRRP